MQLIEGVPATHVRLLRWPRLYGLDSHFVLETEKHFKDRVDENLLQPCSCSKTSTRNNVPYC